MSAKAYGNQKFASIKRANFPPSFAFGVGSSAYQYEGATAEGGRKPCIWDTFIQRYPEKITDHSNADIANDQYHRYKEDVALLKDMGVDVYRFSISWSRVLPNGSLRGGVNQEGINHYNKLINELISNGIKPLVTLFHWDLPEALEDQYQGFLSPKVVDDFRDYAELCFKTFGDRIKLWVTLNEPLQFIQAGYSMGIFAPGRCSDRSRCSAGNSSTEPYIVGHNQLLAHAAAAKLYKEKYEISQKGQIGISLNAVWMVPYSDLKKDKLAATREVNFQFGWFMEPLYNGSYPVEMITNLGERLPKFSKEEAKMVRGSYDFIPINYYTSRYAADIPCPTQNPTFSTDACVNITRQRNGIPIGPYEEGSWINFYPEGIQDLLLHIKHKYNDPVIYITENGVFDPKVIENTTFLDDHSRIEFFQGHLTHVHNAIKRGVKVKGYITWTFLDNFEWTGGYGDRSGMVHVDFKNGLKRTLKKSAIWYKSFLTSKLDAKEL
ncbi:beta glucosidase 12 [Euphorbia peplus]|nr:beta glucosidase 12 [Euphorbia peplus]